MIVENIETLAKTICSVVEFPFNTLKKLGIITEVEELAHRQEKLIDN